MAEANGNTTGVFQTNTYAHLWHASKSVLAVGQAVQAGSTWQFLSSILLTSFAFEAYMNHIGNLMYGKDAWGSLHERKSPIEKLEVIYGKLDLHVHTKQGLRLFRPSSSYTTSEITSPMRMPPIARRPRLLTSSHLHSCRP